MSVLILDDDSSMTIYLIKLFGHLKLVVHPASTLDEAFSILFREPDIECICLDLYLQDGETGFDFMLRLKGFPKLSKIPVIVLSGEADLGTIKKAIESGAYDYMIKPIQPKLMAHILFTLGISSIESLE